MAQFMPHGMCYLWKPELLWLHVASDAVIAVSYFAIPLALLYLVQVKRQELPFHWMFLLFAVFIVACGATHVMNIWNVWNPDYWLSGGVKVVTAIASLGTAALLVPMLPKVVALKNPKELERMNDELQAANAELESFAYSVSHDLRAPLRSADGFSMALLEDYGEDLDETARDYLERIRAASQRMDALIDDLLALSRISRQEIRRERVDLGLLAAEVVEGLRARHPDHDVEVEIGDGLVAEADPRLTRILLENLLDNAWKFTAKESEARVEIGTTMTQEGQRAFHVTDNGVGFDMRYADQLFAPFQRLHSTREFSGTGIGLATVQRVVRRHGGLIEADSVVGERTRITFTLSQKEAK